MWPALLLVALGAITPACTRDNRRVATQPWNVVVLLVDTLRADHLSVYGYERDTTPFLETLLGEWLLFENAYSQAACTFPSVNSLLTSKHPAHFLGRRQGDWAIPEDMVTLPGVLREEGWATLAVSASSVVRKTPSRHNRTGGYDRGFDLFDETCMTQDASCVNRRAAALLEAATPPVFLYLHYVEPHNPYQPPSSHRRRFATGEPEQEFVRRGNIGPLSRMLYRDGRHVELTVGDEQHLVNLYDEEITYFDDTLEPLLATIDRHLDLERTLVVLASDHGEELFDHQQVSHCRDMLWDSVLRVPLLMRVPSAPEGGRRVGQVQNLDIAPTILDYLDLKQRSDAFEGRSLRSLIENERPVHRYVFTAQGTSRAVIDGRWKLLLDLEHGERQLFDRARDPAERENLLAQEQEVAARLSTALERWLERAEGGIESGESVRRAKDIQKQLDALGYL